MSLFSTTGLARWTSRNPWKTVIAWVAILVLGVLSAGTLGDNVTSDFRILSNPEAQKGLDLIEERNGQAPLNETIVITSETLTVDDPAFQAVVTNTANALRAMPEQVDVASVVSYVDLPADQRELRRSGNVEVLTQQRHGGLDPQSRSVPGDRRTTQLLPDVVEREGDRAGHLVDRDR